MRREPINRHSPPVTQRQTETIVWIPFGELQPPASMFYLVTVEDKKFPVILYWSTLNGGWKNPPEFTVSNLKVTAFAHLPEKYKGELTC